MYNIWEFKREVLIFQVKKQFFVRFSVIWNQWTPIHMTFCLYGDTMFITFRYDFALFQSNSFLVSMLFHFQVKCTVVYAILDDERSLKR